MLTLLGSTAQCLKIIEKVSFNIASYVYILSGQKFIENAKNSQFGEFLKNWNLRSDSVTRLVTFKRQKVPKLKKFKCDTVNIVHENQMGPNWVLARNFKLDKNMARFACLVVKWDFLRNFINYVKTETKIFNRTG